MGKAQPYFSYPWRWYHSERSRADDLLGCLALMQATIACLHAMVPISLAQGCCP
jgi:hypothetical protein